MNNNLKLKDKAWLKWLAKMKITKYNKSNVEQAKLKLSKI